jgi:hypothetical protein
MFAARRWMGQALQQPLSPADPSSPAAADVICLSRACDIPAAPAMQCRQLAILLDMMSAAQQLPFIGTHCSEIIITTKHN